MKTNFLKVFVVLFIGVLILEGCRKGENDPLISLRTRDARVTGEWKLVSYESTSTTITTSGSTTVTQTTTNMYDGSLWTSTTAGGTDTYSYSRNLNILKDGTYTYMETEDGDQSEDSGRWSWLSDAKKKRRILLDNEGIFYIDQLKNKEMIFTEEYDDSYIDSNGDSETFTFSSKAVYEKQ